MDKALNTKTIGNMALAWSVLSTAAAVLSTTWTLDVLPLFGYLTRHRTEPTPPPPQKNPVSSYYMNIAFP